MNRHLVYEEVLKRASSFYREYMFDDKLIKTLVRAYIDAFEMMSNYTTTLFNNEWANSCETLRVFPYISFDASDSVYTLTRIARVPRINFLLGVPETYQEQEIIEYWRYTASLEKKVSILNMMGIYTELVSGDFDTYNKAGEVNNRYKGIVVDTELYHEGERKMYKKDYVIKDNKLFILNLDEFNLDNPKIVMRNTTIDYDMCWRRTGSYIGVKYSEIVGRVEYNNLNKMFLRIAATGPYNSSIKEALLNMFPRTDIGVYDAWSIDNPKKYFWESSTQTPDTNPRTFEEIIANDTPELRMMHGDPLSPFDFVITLPQGFMLPSIEDDKSKIDLFRRYLDVIKPAYAYYYINWMEFIEEYIETQELVLTDAHSLDDEIHEDINIKDDPYDIAKEFDNNKVGIDYPDKYDYGNGFFMDYDYATWDMGDYWGRGPDHDIPASAEHPYLVDNFAFKLNKFPEAPVGTKAKYVSTSGVPYVEIRFQNSGIGATYYELFRNNTLISRIDINNYDSRDKIIEYRDTRFTNIKTDTYTLRTVFEKDSNYHELDVKSHDIVVRVES